MSDWFIVGEHGPELAWIPAGSAVIPVQPAMEDPPDTSWMRQVCYCCPEYDGWSQRHVTLWERIRDYFRTTLTPITPYN